MKVKLFTDNSVHKYICTHKNSDLFDKYISEYQEDIVKIVGKYRHPSHALTNNEIISEANILLIKSKQKILDLLGNEFDQVNFKKMAFAYVKNAISWTNYSEMNSKDSKHLSDGVHQSDDGPITTYELALETQSSEDDADLLGSPESLKQFLHVLTEYSYILTEGETKILSYLQKGLTHDEMSEKLGVTRQAISFAFIKLKEKLKSQFNFNDIFSEKRSNGTKAISDFFSKSKKTKMSEKDKKKLSSFASSNPKRYNIREVNKILFNSKYNNKQISAYFSSNKLYHLINKIN